MHACMHTKLDCSLCHACTLGASRSIRQTTLCRTCSCVKQARALVRTVQYVRTFFNSRAAARAFL
jgi:hypothetical protein